jgi:hypothetical protein
VFRSLPEVNLLRNSGLAKYSIAISSLPPMPKSPTPSRFSRKNDYAFSINPFFIIIFKMRIAFVVLLVVALNALSPEEQFFDQVKHFLKYYH